MRCCVYHAVKRLAVVLAMASSTVCCAETSKDTDDRISSKAKNDMMTLTLTSRQTRFMLGENISVTATVENTSGKALDIPDFPNRSDSAFYFELTSPQNEKERFTFFDSLPLPVSQDPGPKYTMAPGARYWGGVNVDERADTRSAGAYTLTAHLSVDGTAYVSSDISFEVAARNNTLTNLAAGLLIRGNKSNGEAAFVQDSADQYSVYRFQFGETHHVGEVESKAPVQLFQQAEKIEQIFIPQNNGSVMGEMSRWVVWRSGRKVNAFIDMAQAPIVWEAPEPIAKIIPGVHKITNGPLEVLVLSADGRKVWMLQADGGFGLTPSHLDQKWEHTLPLSVHAALAIVPALGTQGAHHLALLEQKGNTHAIHLAKYNDQGLSAFNPTTVSGELLNTVVPAALLDEQNLLTVATLATQTNGTDTRMVLNQTRFAADGQGEHLPVQTLTTLGPSDEIIEGLLRYSRSGSAHERLDLVVSFSDGSVKMLRDDTLVLVPTAGEPAMPIQLFSASATSYLLYYSHEHGYYFEPL